MINKLFHSAVVRLTVWYMAIILVLSLLFSVIVFSLASREFDRAFGPRRPGEMSVFINNEAVRDWRQQHIDASNARLLLSLLSFNLITLTLGGVCSYLLATRTLRPIEEAIEMQSRFSTDAAHELRTPLTIMQSETEVTLRDKKAGKTEYAAALRSNLDEINRLHTLTSRLLLLSEQHDLELASVAYDDVAGEAMNRVIPLAQDKRISIEDETHPLKVVGNREALVDVIGILLDNAIKYSPDKATVRMMSRTEDGRGVLEVTDTGAGIDAAHTEKIFDRFYRVDDSRSRQHVEGHGLGLSIASRLIQAQRGSIEVESIVGKGSTFRVRLPLA